MRELSIFPKVKSVTEVGWFGSVELGEFGFGEFGKTISCQFNRLVLMLFLDYWIVGVSE